MATVAQRERVLEGNASRYKTQIKQRQEKVILDLMNEPLDVPGIGAVYIYLSESHFDFHAEGVIQLLDNFENRLTERFNNNKVLKIDAHTDVVDYIPSQDYYTHITIKTREDVRRILDAWTIKRGDLETQSYIWGESSKDRIEKIEGVIPVTNSDGQPLTGIPNLVERERISTELNNKLGYQQAKTDIPMIVIPTGLSDSVLEASQQAMEWLVSAALRKSNWVVNPIEENYTPS